MTKPALLGAFAAHTAAGGGGGFTDPTSLANLVVWLDASDSGNFTTTSATDKSGNGYNFTGSSISYPDGTRNGNSYAFFGASSSAYLVSSSFALATNTATFVYVGSVNWDRQLSMAKTGSSDNNNTDGCNLISNDGGGTVYNSSTLFSNGSNFPTGAWHCYVIIRNGTSWELRRDGVSLGTASSASTAFNADSLAISCLAGTTPGSNHGNGYLGDLVVYSDAKSGTDLSNLESYEITKWGL